MMIKHKVFVNYNNWYIVSLILCFMICIQSAVFAGDDAAEISYEEFILVITQKLPEIRNTTIGVKKAYNTLEQAKSIDDTTIVAKGEYSRQKQYTTGKSLFEPDYKQSYYGYAGIEQTLSGTGTRLSLGLQYDASSVNGRLTLPPQPYSVDEYRPSVTATITQPLLKNAFGIIDRYQKNNAAMKLEIQKLQKSEDDKSVLNYYRKLYFNWILYKQALEIMKESIVNARALLDSVQRKARVGLAENDDVQRAQSSMLGYQAQYTQYEITYNALCDELSLYFNKPINPKIDDLPELFSSIVSTTYTEVPFEKTRSYALIKKNIDAMQYTIDVAENSTLPQMNLIVSATRKNYSDSQSHALRTLPDTDYSVGVEFTYPLGNHDAQGQLNEYELSLTELQNSLLIAQNSYYKNLRVLLQSLHGYKGLIETHSKNLQALVSQHQTEQKKYDQARLDLQYLINTANSIAAERLTILQLKVALIGYWIDYHDLVQ